MCVYKLTNGSDKYSENIHVLMLLIYLFIHSFILLACAECHDSLPFSGVSSTPLCYIAFPPTVFHQLVFHPPSLHLAIYFLVYVSASLFINSYIILLGMILFSSILCSCPNQSNLLKPIVSVIHYFLSVVEISLWLIFSNFLFHGYIPSLKFFYSFSFQGRFIGLFQHCGRSVYCILTPQKVPAFISRGSAHYTDARDLYQRRREILPMNFSSESVYS